MALQNKIGFQDLPLVGFNYTQPCFAKCQPVKPSSSLAELLQAPKCTLDEDALTKMMETAAQLQNVSSSAQSMANGLKTASWLDFVPTSCPNAMTAPGFNYTKALQFETSHPTLHSC